ncbi:MAG: VUT family protein [Actinomycetia bacterium]|nr:VUT family protein [Actinomycetes bacterium]
MPEPLARRSGFVARPIVLPSARTAGLALVCAAYIGTIFAANAAIEAWGIVPVGFGVLAPAGVYFAGLAFTLRDLIHRYGSRKLAIVAIVVGAGLSALVSPELALASGLAFFVSELFDLAVYDRLRRRGWTVAVVASNAIGLLADSALFLWLAFGSLAFFPGQVVGKVWMTVLAVLVIGLLRALRLRSVHRLA